MLLKVKCPVYCIISHHQNFANKLFLKTIRLSVLIASSKDCTEVTSFTFTDFSVAIINQGEITKSPPNVQ